MSHELHQFIQLFINELNTAAANQAEIATDQANTLDVRENAARWHGALLLVHNSATSARDRFINMQLRDLERMLQQAAPPGANPRLIHPSMQPADEPADNHPHLHVVKENPDDINQ